jgi:tetratricopeptide (TPR) repeat protein
LNDGEIVAPQVRHARANPDEVVTEAWAAMNARDWEAALHRWAEMRRDFPDRWEGHVWPVQVLWQAGRLDEADVAAAAADAKFPDSRELLGLRAWLRTARQEWDAALDLWALWRDRFPGRPDGHVWALHILRQTSRLAAAEDLAADALALFPDDPGVLAQRAWLYVTQRQFDEAMTWWTAVREVAPERPDGYVWAVLAMRLAGRMDEAESLVTEALARFPDNADAILEHARVATARGERDEAARRWLAAREKLPAHAEAYTGASAALRLAGRLAEAEAIAAEAVARFPGDQNAVIAQAEIAAARADRGQALRRLAAARDVVPESGRMESGLGWAEYRLRLQAATADEPPTASDAAATAALGELMLAFESLGERCDFGAVQRKNGMEPLGLFRFGLTFFDQLVAALDDGLAAIGAEEDTDFINYGTEYMVKMRKYGLIFHTFTYHHELESGAELDAFRRQQTRRLQFLKRKLLEDLAEGQKIFIFANQHRVGDDDARRLHAALQGYGPNSLLFVRPATDSHGPGTVAPLDDRLYAGYLDRFTDFAVGELPPYDTWRQLCENALRLARGA